MHPHDTRTGLSAIQVAIVAALLAGFVAFVGATVWADHVAGENGARGLAHAKDQVNETIQQAKLGNRHDWVDAEPQAVPFAARVPRMTALVAGSAVFILVAAGHAMSGERGHGQRPDHVRTG